jgi:hypothetical protein
MQLIILFCYGIGPAHNRDAPGTEARGSGVVHYNCRQFYRKSGAAVAS